MLCNELLASCQTLKQALRSNAECKVDRLSGPVGGMVVQRTATERSYLASRVVNVILELSWHAIGACALRPIDDALIAGERVAISSSLSGVDDILLGALRACDGTRPLMDNAFRIWDLQAWCVQLDTMSQQCTKLHAATPNMTFQCFAKSLRWLEEVIEVERMDRARRPQEHPRTAIRDASVLSSEDSTKESDSETEDTATDGRQCLTPRANPNTSS